MVVTVLQIEIFVLLFFTVIGTWKLFEKAGEASWKGFIPVYNIFVWLKVINQPWYWIFFLLLPGFNLFAMIPVMTVSMVRMFRKFSAADTLFAVFLPFYILPKIAFDKDSVYYGETDWSDDKQRKERELSDTITTALSSVGVGNFLVAIFKMGGTKPKPNAKSMMKEWGDALIFALIAASAIRAYVFEPFTIPTPSMEKELLVGDFLFVNKMSYGNRVPMTPLSFPLAHNTIWGTYTNSYVEWIKFPYTRTPGFGEVKRNDIVVFNYPTGDTAVLGRLPDGAEMQGHNYYQFLRSEAFQIANRQGQIKNFFEQKDKFENLARKNILVYNQCQGVKTHGFATRPIDKKENYIKRCVAIAGETLEMRNGQLYVNGEKSDVGNYVQHQYQVVFNRAISDKEKEKFKDLYGFNLKVYPEIIRNPSHVGLYELNMSEDVLNNMKTDISNGEFGNLQLIEVERNIAEVDSSLYGQINAYASIYPNHEKFPWTVDNYGPIWMPKAGATIDLTEDNWILYGRCISVYENNDVVLKNGKYMINGEEATTYTFKQNYYYMIGDNRHNSADSRMWGFVPEDHIVGKGLMIWMSKDAEKGWSNGIRWNRIFRMI